MNIFESHDIKPFYAQKNRRLYSTRHGNDSSCSYLIST